MELSTPRTISPMLDGFFLGQAFSSHDAVQCFPAVERRSKGKFIVKVISVPRSRVQMDALLRTGVFTSKQAANNYYKEQAREAINEAKLLRHLATKHNFLDFDCFQVVPGEDDYGYDMYLLSPYRNSLQNLFESGSLSHRDVIYLALDMVSALMLCRREGYLYLNLKPTNIYRTIHGFCIGDLGFVPISEGSTPRLPDQYRSAYTPPELLADPTALNETSDVYQLGLLLYQAYNGGALPGKNDVFGSLYAPPKYADFEMTKIILRACSLDPSIRWVDPEQLRQALEAYARKVEITDEPIAPLAQAVEAPQPVPAPVVTKAVKPVEPPAEPAQAPTPAAVPEPKKQEKRRFPFTKWQIAKALIVILALVVAIEVVIWLSLWLQNKASNKDDSLSATKQITSIQMQQDDTDGLSPIFPNA